MSALRELREMVEAGEWPADFLAVDCEPLRTVTTASLYAAFSGSLDAAKALHEALLPEWGYQLTLYPEAHLYQPKDLRRIGPVYADDCHGGELSRAWLLAILSALIAKEADNAGQ